MIADDRTLLDSDLPGSIVRQSGKVDVLIANPAMPARSAADVRGDDWSAAFAHMADLPPRLMRAILPQMIERGSGQILLIGSSSALRGMKRASAYGAARGTQRDYVQSAGVEVAQHGMQVNAIAQNFVENPTYFPTPVQESPAFRKRLKRTVPSGRLATRREDVMFAAYLCTDAANCFVGQVFPVCGGWVTG